MTSTQSNRPTSTPYVPPQRRNTPSSRPAPQPPAHSGQPYLNYEDLHARYSPPNSPSLRMPSVQRSLSAEGLFQRFRGTGNRIPDQQQQENHREQDSSPGQDSPALLPSPPPPLPRDFEALRAYSHRSPFGYSRSPPPPLQRPQLSPRFPDPPVFNGSNNILFEDWKLRIRDKLIVNKDHYLSEFAQVAYTITRLGGKAIEYTLPKRRTNSYHSVDELLDQLSDIYETPLQIVQEENYEALYNLSQHENQSFPDFYSEFMRIAGDTGVDFDLDLVWKLQTKVNNNLRFSDGLFNFLYDHRDPSLLQLKERLISLDLFDRNRAVREERSRAREFASQCARAEAEMKAKKPGKYAIMPRPDPEEFRR